MKMRYDPTRPVSVEFWMLDLGDRRPTPAVVHVIAPTELAALKFAAEVAVSRGGLDLETVSRENLYLDRSTPRLNAGEDRWT